MSVPQVALDHRAAQVRTAAAASLALRGLWAQVDVDNITASWAQLIPQAVALLSAAQLAAAGLAEGYLATVIGNVAPPVAELVPGALAGTASDGRDLGTLMAQPAITVLDRIRRGETPQRAMATGLWQLDTITRTQVADAGRAADQVAMTARPGVVAYTRVVNAGACARCIILAGREYPYSTGFQRHPQCDCQMLPLRPGQAAGMVGTDPRDLFNAMSEEQQNRRFGRDAAEAIRMGADIAQVVNARRGMQSAGDRRRGRYTTEGTTVRGYAGRRLGDLTDTSGRFRRSARQRLMPEVIIREARDRDHALELLYEHGYLTERPRPQTSTAPTVPTVVTAPARTPEPEPVRAPEPEPARPARPAPAELSDAELDAEMNRLIAEGGEDADRLTAVMDEVDRREAAAARAEQERQAREAEELRRLSDDEITERMSAAYAADDTDLAERLLAELDRRDAEEEARRTTVTVRREDFVFYDDDRLAAMAEQARAEGRDADVEILESELAERRRLAEELPPAVVEPDPDETPAERRRRERDEQEYADMARLVEQEGYTWEEAAAEVQGRSIESVRREAFLLEHRAHGDKRSFTEVAREQYKLDLERRFVEAETATRGFLLSNAGQAAGINPRDLFQGPRSRAEKWASEELKNWWDENGRYTFEEYVEMIESGQGLGPGRDYNR